MHISNYCISLAKSNFRQTFIKSRRQNSIHEFVEGSFIHEWWKAAPTFIKFFLALVKFTFNRNYLIPMNGTFITKTLNFFPVN